MPNQFPVKGGISDIIIPTTIVTGKSIHYKKDTGLHIGHYCQVYEEYTPCNSNKPRTKGTVCMVRSRNIKSGFNFMILSSIKNIISLSLDMIPMPDTVIEWANILVKY